MPDTDGATVRRIYRSAVAGCDGAAIVHTPAGADPTQADDPETPTATCPLCQCDHAFEPTKFTLPAGD